MDFHMLPGDVHDLISSHLNIMDKCKMNVVLKKPVVADRKLGVMFKTMKKHKMNNNLSYNVKKYLVDKLDPTSLGELCDIYPELKQQRDEKEKKVVFKEPTVNELIQMSRKASYDEFIKHINHPLIQNTNHIDYPRLLFECMVYNATLFDRMVTDGVFKNLAAVSSYCKLVCTIDGIKMMMKHMRPYITKNDLQDSLEFCINQMLIESIELLTKYIAEF